MEHLEQMESELQAKYSMAQVGEEQLQSLQEEFLEFREAKRKKEGELKVLVEKTKFDLDNLKREKD